MQSLGDVRKHGYTFVDCKIIGHYYLTTFRENLGKTVMKVFGVSARDRTGLRPMTR